MGLKTHGKGSSTLNNVMGQSAPRPAAQTQAEDAMAQGTTNRLLDAMASKKEALGGDTPRSTVRSNPKVSSGPKQFERMQNRRADERLAP